VGESDQRDLVDFCDRAFGVELQPEDVGRIDRFLDLLEVWNRRLRLTGGRDRSTLLRKHVADAVRCVPLMPHGASFLDLGTGAGFPGVVVACVRPDLRTTLLDAKQRPVSFLGEVIRSVPLPRARAVRLRAEEAANDATLARSHDVITSRAIRIEQFVELAKPLLVPGGLAISMQSQTTARPAADAVARRADMHVIALHDYRLPDGEPRRLVVMA
jgi:16S rRNA (guanine527-N7)-methyltransferase